MADTGPSHNRSGASYTGTCMVCQMWYRGETCFNTHSRLGTHEKQIRGNIQANSIAWHLAGEHLARRLEPSAYSFTIEKTGERPLPWQMREAQKIANEDPGQIINRRNEHTPPAIWPLIPGHLRDREAMSGDER